MLNKKKILKDFVTDFVTHSTFNRLGLQINRFRRFCLRRANVILSCHLSVLQSVSELLLLKKNCREILYLFFPPIFVYTLQFRLNSDKIGRHFPQWDLRFKIGQNRQTLSTVGPTMLSLVVDVLRSRGKLWSL